MAAEQPPQALPALNSAGSLALFRYCSYDTPFWVLKNTRAGRWHVTGDEPTQYWSSTPDAAWAELIRAEGLRTEEELDLVRMPIWVCRFPSSGLLDLRSGDAQKTAKVREADLIADDWSACQTLGAELRESYAGAIAPCAALEGHANVTIFGPRRMIDWRERAALASAVPACVASFGRPRPNLVQHVRHKAARPQSPTRGGQDAR